MDIKIDHKHINEVVSAAILQTIDREGRDAMIQSAIRELLKPAWTNLGTSQTTIINEIFSTAVKKEANAIAERMISESEDFRKKVRDLVTEAMIRFFNNENKDEMSLILSRAIANCIEDKTWQRV